MFGKEGLKERLVQDQGASSDFLAPRADKPPAPVHIARFTSFALLSDAYTSGGFGAMADRVEEVFAAEILPRVSQSPGFVDCQHLLDLNAGQCIIVSFWDGAASAAASRLDAALQDTRQLAPFVRWAQFKTEEFEVLTIGGHAADAANGGGGGAAEDVVSAYARLTRISLRRQADPLSSAPASAAAAAAGGGRGWGAASCELPDLAAVDVAFREMVHFGAHGLPGFRGAQRFVGTGEAAGTCLFATYWDSVGTLQASGRDPIMGREEQLSTSSFGRASLGGGFGIGGFGGGGSSSNASSAMNSAASSRNGSHTSLSVLAAGAEGGEEGGAPHVSAPQVLSRHFESAPLPPGAAFARPTAGSHDAVAQGGSSARGNGGFGGIGGQTDGNGGNVEMNFASLPLGGGGRPKSYMGGRGSGGGGGARREQDSFAAVFNGFLSAVTGIGRFAQEGSIVTTDYAATQFGRTGLRPAVRGLFEEGSAEAATFQLACISLGAGIFGMPGVFARLGLGSGVGLVLLFALLSDFAMQSVLRAATASGAETFQGVVGAALGRHGRSAALLALAFSLFTANCAHVQFISEVFTDMAGPGGGFLGALVGRDSAKAQKTAAMLLFGGLALPFCFKRRLAELRHVSLAAVACCLTISVVVSVKLALIIGEGGSCTAMGATGAAVSCAPHNTALFKSVSLGTVANEAPIVAFGFSVIAELFAVREEAQDPEELGRSVHVATAIVALIYASVGLLGALAFEDPGQNLLTNFPGDHLVALLSLLLVFALTLLYPLINFPTTQCLDALWAGEGGALSLRRRRVFSVLGLGAVVAVDTLLPNVGEVFGISGSLGLGLIAYVLPCAASLAFPEIYGGAWRAALWVVLAVGAALTLGSTGQIIFTA
jgi:amino acid permease